MVPPQNPRRGQRRNNFDREAWWDILKVLHPEYSKEEVILPQQEQNQELLDQILRDLDINIPVPNTRADSTPPVPITDQELLNFIHAYQEESNSVVYDNEPDYSHKVVNAKCLSASVRSFVNKGIKFNPSEKPKFITYSYKGQDIKDEMDIHVRSLLREGIISKTNTPLCCSPLFGIRKANGKLRLVHDLRNINATLPKLSTRFPSIKNIKDAILESKAIYFTKIDLKNGYFHLNLSPKFKRYVCFKFKDSFYNFNKLPFGLSTAPAMFQRFTNDLVKNFYKGSNIINYLDDFLIMGSSYKETKKTTIEFLRYLDRANILVNKSKCVLKPSKKIKFLGLEFTSKNLSIPEEKRTTALKLLDTYNRLDAEQKRAANGYLNFYRGDAYGSLAALRILMRNGDTKPIRNFFTKKKIKLFPKNKVIFTAITDATPTSQAIITKDFIIKGSFKLNIFYSELLTLIQAWLMGANNLVSDCLPALQTLAKGASSNLKINYILSTTGVFPREKPKTYYVKTDLNPADAVSRDLQLDLTRDYELFKDPNVIKKVL